MPLARRLPSITCPGRGIGPRSRRDHGDARSRSGRAPARALWCRLGWPRPHQPGGLARLSPVRVDVDRPDRTVSVKREKIPPPAVASSSRWRRGRRARSPMTCQRGALVERSITLASALCLSLCRTTYKQFCCRGRTPASVLLPHTQHLCFSLPVEKCWFLLLRFVGI